jgi:hypothetical protein
LTLLEPAEPYHLRAGWGRATTSDLVSQCDQTIAASVN